MRSPLRPSRTHRSRVRRLAAAVACLFAVAAAPGGAAAASPPPHALAIYVPISGAGSTWSANAIRAWQANISAQGITVNYQDSGSSDGRNQFKNGTADFGVSEIPYDIPDNGVVDPKPTRPFAYLPIVAGGTSFMYHLDSGGRRITNLRLDGPTIARIFTGVLTMWNDPEIKSENPGVALPPIKIVPVVRQDGSGTTAQLTTWMAATQASIWDGYCGKLGRATPCGTTSFYPIPSGVSNFYQASGSNGVAGYVAQDIGEGAITYVEYSYATLLHFPVVKVLNQAGYYVPPTAYNVAVGLQQVKINADLTQDLRQVYTDSDSRTYPLSSYSYMIVPLSNEKPFNDNKGYTFGKFAYYFLCAGQSAMSSLGYSPLPINLVQAGFDVVRKVPGVEVQSIDISKCNNPTFSAGGGNNLAKIAPKPPACDAKSPSSQCAPDGVTPTGGGTTGGASGGATGGTVGGTGTTGGTTGGAAGGTTGGRTGGAVGGVAGGAAGGVGGATAGGVAGLTGGVSGGAGAGAAGAVGGAADGGSGGVAGGVTTDPETGKVVNAAGGTTSGGTVGGAQAIADSVTVGSGISDTFQQVLMCVAVLLLLGLAIGPPVLSRRLARRGRDGGRP